MPRHPLRIVLTGAGGIVGGFVLRAARAAGHQVTALGREDGWRLGLPAELRGHDALIHCAFAHAPGRYRGGEGDDPQGFRSANLDGSIRLFDEAAAAGLSRILFMSSRAVHDGWPAGTALPDDLPPRPANLYGEVKALAEAHLAALPLATTAIRATGIYGPGRANKWQGLFADYLAGRPVTPRVATEIHGADLADAVLLLIAHPAPPATVNASDLILDRRDLLGMVAALTDCPHPLPDRADASALLVPRCKGLRGMDWQPGGFPRLRRTLPDLLDSGGASPPAPPEDI